MRPCCPWTCPRTLSPELSASASWNPVVHVDPMYVCMYEGVLTYLLLGCALEHGVHEAAEHDQQLLLVDVAQPQRGPTCMYVCSQ